MPNVCRGLSKSRLWITSDFLISKGSTLQKRRKKIHIGCIYPERFVSVPLAPKTQAYQESSGNLDMLFAGQTKFLRDIEIKEPDNLNNLWASHLLEHGQYKKAAYPYVLDGVRANLPVEILQHHMEKGFKEALILLERSDFNANRTIGLIRKIEGNQIDQMLGMLKVLFGCSSNQEGAGLVKERAKTAKSRSSLSESFVR